MIDDAGSVLSPSELAIEKRLEADVEFQTALVGPEGDHGRGCASTTSATVYGPDGESGVAIGDLSNLDSEVTTLVRASAEYRALEREWVACMAQSGYAFEDRDVFSNVAWKDPRPTAEERQTALADFDCRAAVDWGTRYNAVQHREHDRLADERAEFVSQRAATIRKWARALSEPLPTATDGS